MQCVSPALLLLNGNHLKVKTWATFGEQDVGNLRPAVVKNVVSDLARSPGSRFLQLLSLDSGGEGWTLDRTLLESFSVTVDDPLLNVALGANFLTMSR